MVTSISEQKMALAAYSTESDLPALTARQLELAEKIIAICHRLMKKLTQFPHQLVLYLLSFHCQNV